MNDRCCRHHITPIVVIYSSGSMTFMYSAVEQTNNRKHTHKKPPMRLTEKTPEYNNKKCFNYKTQKSNRGIWRTKHANTHT